MSTQLAIRIIDGIVSRCTPIFDVVYFYGDGEIIGGLFDTLAEKYRGCYPNSKIIRKNAMEFYEETFQYISDRNNSMPVCDVFIFENIEMIAGLETNEQRLYGMLDALLENRRQIIISGTLPIAAIKKLSPRICAQIEGGISLAVE